MLNLKIDNKPVFPTDGGNVEIHAENPFFSRAGTYTYDMDIELSDKRNQQVYQHLDRLNAHVAFKDRQAVLSDDEHFICDGKEVLLELNESTLKIQLVSENSELNYLSSRKSMKDLNLGRVQRVTAEQALSMLNKSFPEVIGTYCPILLKHHSYPEYYDKSLKFANLIDSNTHTSQKYEKDTEFILQPYLLYVIEETVRQLGWKLDYNVLREDEQACKMIVVHGFRTTNINEMIPNWKVNDFLSEIEAFFNVILVCDAKSHSISIHRIHEYYEKQSKVTVIADEDILSADKSPAQKFDVNDAVFFNYDKFKYNFESDINYQCWDLSPEIVKCLIIKDFFDIGVVDLKGLYNIPFLFENKETETYHMVSRRDINSSKLYYFRLVNCFRRIGWDNEENEAEGITFKICPAEVLAVDLKPQINGTFLEIGAAIPFARNQDGTEIDSSEENGLNEWVQSGPPKEYDSSGNNLYVAYYVGWVNVLHNKTFDPNPEIINLYNSINYPQCVTFPYIDYCLREMNSQDYFFGCIQILRNYPNWRKYNLNLKYLLETNYSKNTQIDTTHEYEINFRFHEWPDVRTFFNISNRLFYCKEIVYKFEKGVLQPEATGVFYPVT